MLSNSGQFCVLGYLVCFNTLRGLVLRQGSRSLHRISGFITPLSRWHSAQLDLEDYPPGQYQRILEGLSFMDSSTVCLSVFVALTSTVAMFRIYKMNSFRVKVVGYRSQTMCHTCHAITARAEANCQHCGKPLRKA